MYVIIYYSDDSCCNTARFLKVRYRSLCLSLSLPPSLSPSFPTIQYSDTNSTKVMTSTVALAVIPWEGLLQCKL